MKKLTVLILLIACATSARLQEQIPAESPEASLAIERPDPNANLRG